MLKMEPIRKNVKTSTSDLIVGGKKSEYITSIANRSVDVSCHGNNFYDIKELADSFKSPGDFAEIQDYIEELKTIEIMEKKFQIIFKKEKSQPGSKREREKFIKKFTELQPVNSGHGCHYKLQVLPKNKNNVLVTLYPVLFDTTDDVIWIVVHSNNWGHCEQITRAVHQSHSNWKNGCVHVTISNMDRSNIPDTIVIDGVTAFITVQKDRTSAEYVEENESSELYLTS